MKFCGMLSKGSIWSNKNGQLIATDKTFLGFDKNNNPFYGESITDYKEATKLLGYTDLVGEFYIPKKEGKEIRLTPNKILITNNHGMSVELSDKQGIKISSDGSDRINISSANGALELSASNRIVLKQGNTTMKMAEGISFNGAKINLQ